MSATVSAAAHELAARSIGGADRVLVTGASGWFGRTTLELLPRTAPVLAIASRTKTIVVAGREHACLTWDRRLVAEFAPTIVVDCAFLTRDRTSDVPLESYVAQNRMLTDRLVDAATLPSVRGVVTISSGAAVHPRDAREALLEENPYGVLKREAEFRLAEAVGARAAAVVARAWSVSGAHVQKPQNYALGSMILAAARDGAIEVTARRPVFRRYVLADELLAIALAELRDGSTTVDSGGDLVEMSELAAGVIDVIAPGGAVGREPLESTDPDDYHSDGVDWLARIDRWRMRAAPLPEQIALTAAGVLARPFSPR